MRAVVVYESMYGNTRAVAEAITDGLAATTSASAVPVAEAAELGNVDLLVLGAPTHTWGMSRPSTRRGAVQAADKPGSGLTVEPGAAGPGMREWLDRMPCVPTRVAIFDTRMKAPLGLSGSAAKRIARAVRSRGLRLAGAPQRFTVSKQNRLLDGELDRAHAWGAQLAAESISSSP
jgi:hypothetical protein